MNATHWKNNTVTRCNTYCFSVLVILLSLISCANQNEFIDGEDAEITSEDGDLDNEDSKDQDLDEETNEGTELDNIDGNEETENDATDRYEPETDEEHEAEVETICIEGLPGELINPEPWKTFRQCPDMPAQYKNTWQIVNPISLPKLNFGIAQTSHSTWAMAENGHTMFKLNDNNKWQLIPVDQQLIRAWVRDPIIWRNQVCVIADKTNECAIACIDEENGCFECVVPDVNPLADDQGFGMVALPDDDLLFSSYDYVQRRRYDDGRVEKENVACEGDQYCIISRFFDQGRKAIGFAISHKNQAIRALFEYRLGEWIQVDSFPDVLDDTFLGIGQPLTYQEQTYFYSNSFEDNLPEKAVCTFGRSSETLFYSIFEDSSDVTFGGIEAFGLGFLGQNNGYLLTLEPGEIYSADKIFPGDVYNFSFYNDLLYAAGSGFISKYDGISNWIDDTDSIFDPIEADKNQIIAGIDGPGKNHYFSLAEVRSADPNSSSWWYWNHLFEINGCRKRKIPIQYLSGGKDSPHIAWSKDLKILMVGEGGHAFRLTPNCDAFQYFKYFNWTDKHFVDLEAGITTTFVGLLCEDYPWNSECKLVAFHDYTYEEIATFDVGNDYLSVMEISPGLLLVAERYKLLIYNLEDPTRDVVELHYPDSRAAYNTPIIKRDITNNAIAYISNFKGGFYSWSQSQGFIWYPANDPELILKDIMKHGDRFHAAGQYATEQTSGDWQEVVNIAGYSGNFDMGWYRTAGYSATDHLTILGDRLISYGDDQTIFGLDIQGSDIPYVQCPQVGPDSLYLEDICPGTCPHDNRISDVQCTNGECFIPGDEFCISSCRTVNISSYYIDETEVSNLEYAQCVDAGNCSPPRRQDLWQISKYYDNPEYVDYPVAYITHSQATDFCSFLGKRLPTEAEWQLAAMGYERKAYPFEEVCSNTQEYAYECDAIGWNHKGPVSINELPLSRSPMGLMNMGGNMAEWVHDYYDPLHFYTSEEINDPTGPDVGDWRVVRGGQWAGGNLDKLLKDGRNAYAPDYSSMFIGFRCARSAELK